MSINNNNVSLVFENLYLDSLQYDSLFDKEKIKSLSSTEKDELIEMFFYTMCLDHRVTDSQQRTIDLLTVQIERNKTDYVV